MTPQEISERYSAIIAAGEMGRHYLNVDHAAITGLFTEVIDSVPPLLDGTLIRPYLGGKNGVMPDPKLDVYDISPEGLAAVPDAALPVYLLRNLVVVQHVQVTEIPELFLVVSRHYRHIIINA